MKTLSALLAQRCALLKRARLANLAYAYRTLERFAQRIARARLRGQVALKSADPAADRYWPTLTALEGNQSVLEEHFSDGDLVELADVLGFVLASDSLDLTFHLEDVTESFVAPVRGELARAGVSIDPDPATAEKESQPS